MKEREKDDAASQTPINLNNILARVIAQGTPTILLDDEISYLARLGDGTLISHDKERLVLTIQFADPKPNNPPKKDDVKISFAEYLDWIFVQDT